MPAYFRFSDIRNIRSTAMACIRSITRFLLPCSTQSAAELNFSSPTFHLSCTLWTLSVDAIIFKTLKITFVRKLNDSACKFIACAQTVIILYITVCAQPSKFITC